MNCQPDTAFRQMMDTKKAFGKVDKRQGYHLIISFKEGEVSPDTAYEITQGSKNINVGNRKKLINGNGFVFGVPGSGKSFFYKMEMGSVFLSGNDEIIVIDPMNEYFDIAETYGGTVVNMSTYTDNYVNPLAMDVWNLDQNDTKGWVREKGEFMLGLCEQCIGDSLNSRQKSIIDRCVRKLYIDIARSREKYIPIMSDFYDLLLEQPEEEATTMLANSEFVALLKQANTDSSKMAEVIGVSEAQLRFVTNTASGMGLIKCGSVVIPFDNQISKDTDLYKLYNTNIHEKIAEQKAKENAVAE